ncbi:Rhodanese-like protein [Bimuria novae-zelandiae CBS 107.79]|uniref:Rhodanese-like protein n=1 Tax=Bimuria novae-zelandiae CBS 107.79 TaxID=1447943 RepID=A0A6A5VR68_9PLEO|nr:Rhodanese-like protein [Bimuria novae-zelandiae CBS 107.79]
MSDISFSDLTFISREELAEQFRNSPSASQAPDNLAIIDVRDSDHVGGHIKGSTWVPSSELDFKTPELVRSLKDKEVVVFHCALSQQRGPSAALRYLREKRRLDPESTTVTKEGKGGKEKKEQRVVVLKGGFTQWQEKYGLDETLTEGWQKDIWEFGS